MTIAVLSYSFNILMLLLYHQTIFLSQSFALEEDLLVDSVLDGRASGEGFELCQFLVVEVEGAVLGPCQLILALTVESDAAGLHE